MECRNAQLPIEKQQVEIYHTRETRNSKEYSLSYTDLLYGLDKKNVYSCISGEFNCYCFKCKELSISTVFVLYLLGQVCPSVAENKRLTLVVHKRKVRIPCLISERRGL